jgi:hypothetical protein
MATGAVIARIISEYSDKGTKQATKDLNKVGKQFDDFGKKVAHTFAVAAAASAALAIKIGTDAVKAAMEDQKSQVLLANSLRNTIGATDSAIASVENYITKTQALYSVADDKLRPSLAALVASFGSVGEAEKMQAIALDISANKNIDLMLASNLLAKAHGGNLGALKKLFPEITAATVKSKDFATALNVVAAASRGAAAASADTLAGRLEGLKLAYGEILETLGYALMPVIQKFATYLTTDVLPAIQKWVDANKEKLAASLENAATFLRTLLKRMGQFALWVTDNTKTIKTLGILIAAMWTVGKIAAFINAIHAITVAFAALRATALGAAIAEAFATAGVSLGAGAAALAAVGLATVGLAYVKKQLDGSNDKATKATESYSDAMARNSFNSFSMTKATTKNSVAVNKLTADQIKATKVAAQLLAVQKQLADKGVVATSVVDPIQLEAVRLNLLKQHNVELDATYARLMANYEAQMSGNVAAQKYADILGVIADKDISVAEIGMLSVKWKESQAEVIAYIAQIIGADTYSKNLTNPGAITAMGWQNALSDLDAYISTLKTIPTIANPGALAPAGQTGAPSSQGYGSTQAVTDTLKNIDQAVQDALDAASAADAAVAAASEASTAADNFLSSLGLNSPKKDIGGHIIGSPVPNFTPFSGYPGAQSSSSSGGGGITVIVNNAGSVISNSDLVTSITQGLQQAQLSGKAINLTATMF